MKCGKNISPPSKPVEMPFKASVARFHKRQHCEFGGMFNFLIKHLTDPLNYEASFYNEKT